MAFNELRGFAREIALEKQVEELQTLYRKSQKDLKRRLETIDLSDFQKQRTEALLLQVNRQLAELDIAARKWSKKAVPMSYEMGLEIAEERLRKLDVTRFVNYDAQIHASAVAVLVDDVTLDLLTANQTIKNNVNRYIRLTQQRILEDREISKRVAEGLIQGETRRAVSDNILNDFRKRLGDEQFITINGRNYKPEAYSRLLARTRFVEATNRANINTSLQYGVDLVQVSVHYHPQTDPCSRHQGKIYSISGGDPDFPPLEESPPFHPNCRHQLLPITRESLEDRGLLEGSIKFSKSDREMGVSSFKEFEEEINV